MWIECDSNQVKEYKNTKFPSFFFYQLSTFDSAYKRGKKDEDHRK